jgi:hypothetical protein
VKQRSERLLKRLKKAKNRTTFRTDSWSLLYVHGTATDREEPFLLLLPFKCKTWIITGFKRQKMLKREPLKNCEKW